jgi:hypothetical protein
MHIFLKNSCTLIRKLINAINFWNEEAMKEKCKTSVYKYYSIYLATFNREYMQLKINIYKCVLFMNLSLILKFIGFSYLNST